jgi:hypothetical protein
MSGRDASAVSAYRRPMGYQQISNASLQASIGLTLPANANGWAPGYVVIQVQGGNVRWRDDGVAPTAAVGMTLPSGAELDYSGDLSMLRFISSSLVPILDVSYYA